MDEKEKIQRQVLYIGGCHGGIEPGSFRELIIRAAFTTDTENSFKLMSAFPEIIGAVKAYQTGLNIKDYPIIKECVENQK